MTAKPSFLNICATARGFNIFRKSAWVRNKAYPGFVVASADAFHFAINEANVLGAVAATGGAVGGLIGGLLAGRGPRNRVYLPVPIPSVEEKNLTELPRSITGHPDWPVPWDEGPVIVVPRQAVRSVSTSFWMGGIDIDVGEVVLRVFTPIFQRKKLGSRLGELGWEVQGL